MLKKPIYVKTRKRKNYKILLYIFYQSSAICRGLIFAKNFPTTCRKVMNLSIFTSSPVGIKLSFDVWDFKILTLEQTSLK